MAGVMSVRSGNPALSADTFAKYRASPGVEQMTHQGGRASVAQKRGELGNHRATYFLFTDEWAIDELATLEAVLDDAAFLEARQQRGNRGLGQVALGTQAGLYLQYGRLGAFPENAHDGELEVGERRGHWGEGKRCCGGSVHMSLTAALRTLVRQTRRAGGCRPVRFRTKSGLRGPACDPSSVPEIRHRFAEPLEPSYSERP